MVAVVEGSIRRFRCHTGHGFSEGALIEQSLAKIEQTLWWALAQMEEAQILLGEIADRPMDVSAQFGLKRDELRRLGQLLQDMATDPAFGRDAPEPEPQPEPQPEAPA